MFPGAIYFFLILLSLGILPRDGSAQGPPWRKDWGERGDRGMVGPPHPPMMDWAGQLNLTPEQSAEIRELRGAYLRDTMAWRNELVIKRFDLRDLLRNPDSDPNAILAKQKELSELEAKIQERGLLLHLQMRQVLTPEQMKLLPPQWEGVPGRAMRPGLRRGREY